MKHAYLIIAHSNWTQLKRLIELLDDKKADIFIHIDNKAKNVPIKSIISAAKYSKVYIYRKFKVYWGSYEMVEAELLLFDEAHKRKYNYYHLISGNDLPIKTQRYIHDFFERNAGFEFIHYDTQERLNTDKEIRRRTSLYHFLQNYRNRYRIKCVNLLFTFFERILLFIQLVFGVDRMKQHREIEIKYGSQWVSITDELVAYILDQRELIHEIFCWTNCADELFIQTIVYNSHFKERLYNQKFNDDIMGNLRLIDMKQRGSNGHPYIWRDSDWEEIMCSNCLFARKFSTEIDAAIVDRICRYVSGE